VSEYLGSWSKTSTAEWNQVSSLDLQALQIKSLSQGEFWYVWECFPFSFENILTSL
jgi:hypothetical protein